VSFTILPPTEQWPGGKQMAADGTVYGRKLLDKRMLVDGEFKTFKVPGPLRKIGKVEKP
jgi:hypothetical protein